MNFDTRTVLDILTLDGTFAREIEALILEEREMWKKAGKTSNNDFVKSVIPLVRDSIRTGVIQSLNSLKLPHISKYINYGNIDYFQLIPTLAKI